MTQEKLENFLEQFRKFLKFIGGNANFKLNKNRRNSLEKYSFATKQFATKHKLPNFYIMLPYSKSEQ